MELDIYGVMVFLHVFSAIISIGPLFLLMPIIRRARGVAAEVEQAYMSVINVIIRIVMHAGHLLVVTGAILVFLGPWLWYTSWVIMTLVILLLSGVFLATGFTRVLRKFNTPGTNKDAILRRLNRTSWGYIGLMLIMLWLMVEKPMLW